MAAINDELHELDNALKGLSSVVSSLEDTLQPFLTQPQVAPTPQLQHESSSEYVNSPVSRTVREMHDRVQDERKRLIELQGRIDWKQPEPEEGYYNPSSPTGT